MKTKTQKASVLVVSLIILGVMLTASLSMALVSGLERRASMGASKTGAAFQAADKGIEVVLRDLKQNSAIVDTGDIPNCQTGSSDEGFIVDNSNNYKVELKDKTGAQIDCDDAKPLSDIASIKSVGIIGQNSRAIEAEVDLQCVSNCAQLQALQARITDKPTERYCLAKDINCSSLSGKFVPLTGFEGSFDGQNHVISNLDIDSTSSGDVGLFATAKNGAGIYNLGIDNSGDTKKIKGGDRVGGLVGTCDECYLSEVFVKSEIEGEWSVGGLIGLANKLTVIDNSYFNGKLTSSEENPSGVGNFFLFHFYFQ